MAIDNRLTADGYRTEDGKYARSMVRTRGKKGPAWWQVDLGKTCDIDRIVVHSPTTYSQRMNPFYVMVLNESEDPANDLVWESALIQQPPSPSLELTDSDSKSLIIKTATTDMLDHEDDACYKRRSANNPATVLDAHFRVTSQLFGIRLESP